MNKEFLKYEEALALKELGFDEPCLGIHYNEGLNPFFMVASQYGEHGATANGGILAPLYQQAFRWFREKYDLQCWPEPTGSNRYCCKYDGNDETGYRWVGYLRNDNKEILFYLTYEEAELECLKKLIELVKK
jgi:hypothetical protein